MTQQEQDALTVETYQQGWNVGHAVGLTKQAHELAAMTQNRDEWKARAEHQLALATQRAACVSNLKLALNHLLAMWQGDEWVTEQEKMQAIATDALNSEECQ